MTPNELIVELQYYGKEMTEEKGRDHCLVSRLYAAADLIEALQNALIRILIEDKK